MSKITRVTIHQQVMDEIMERIKNDIWKPGTKLPSENEMCALFGVSRHAVRESIRSLEELSILETFNGQGTFVREVAPENFSRHLASLLIIDKIAISELYEFRYNYEPMLIPMAIRNITKDEIENLLALAHESQAQADLNNAIAFEANDQEFHAAISKATKNKIATVMAQTLGQLIKDSYDQIVATEEKLQASAKFHNKIAQAIARRDVDESIGQMRLHIKDVEKQY